MDDELLKKRLARFDEEGTEPGVTNLYQNDVAENSEEEDLTVDHIPNPFLEDYFPMILFRSEGQEYIGGFASEYENGYIDVVLPMVYIERLGPPPSTAPESGPQLQVGVQKIYLAIESPKTMRFKYSNLYFLQDGLAKCHKLVNMYEDIVKSTMAADSFVEAPTNQDILNFGKSNERL